MFDRKGTKDWFRDTRRMFDELREEREAEKQAEADAPALRERRERIATAVMANLFPDSDADLSAAAVARMAIDAADALIRELDREEA